MLRSSREKLKFYMQEKNDVIVGRTGINLYHADDFDWVDTLDTDELQVIIRELKRRVREGNEGLLTSGYCPQCIHQDNICTGCPYRKNHGPCDVFTNNVTGWVAVMRRVGENCYALDGEPLYCVNCVIKYNL